MRKTQTIVISARPLPILCPFTFFFVRVGCREVKLWIFLKGLRRNINLDVLILFPDAPLSVVPVHLRGGTVFPCQTEAMNTDASRRNPWRLLVALDEVDRASGEVFVDDGESIDTLASGKYLLVRR